MYDAQLTGVTQLIKRWGNGEPQALDQLIDLVYQQLSQKARDLMKDERTGHLLETSALVHEAYLRLIELNKIRWQGRKHFFAVIGGVMRRILVDQSRVRNSYKRGGNAQAVTFNEQQLGDSDKSMNVDMQALDESLSKLSAKDELQAKIVELRYFAGLSIEETAEALCLSPATVKRKWTLARSQLYRDLHPSAV